MDSTVNSTGSDASVDYRKKRIKNVQKVELVRLMKANFLFIRGKHAVARSEKSRADVWKIITGRLNSLGPPVQSTEAWQRRWNDMRSATKSKMAKIQNYIREHGEDCPYKLNLVERLIWDTFSVKPEEYMKDLNMKLWREKQHENCEGLQQQFAVDSVSPCSSEMSTEQSNDMGWNQTGPTCHGTGLAENSRMSFASMSKENSVLEYSNQTAGGFYGTSSCNQTDQNYGAQPSTSMSYQGYPSSATNQWNSSGLTFEQREDAALHQTKITSSTDLVSGNKTLWELNKLFEVVLRQNEEILILLRQSNSVN
uniref:Regulatory protein zeste n=1 Tax=Anopheles culicifacies TaxID=139723 RepID=A0A182MFR1_9DIPT